MIIGWEGRGLRPDQLIFSIVLTVEKEAISFEIYPNTLINDTKDMLNEKPIQSAQYSPENGNRDDTDILINSRTAW